MPTVTKPSVPLARALVRLEDALLVALLAVLIILAGAQILLRTFWNSGIVWADPLLRVLVLWVGLLGALVATRLDKHIRIDLLARYLPPRLNRLNRRLTDAASAAVCALLAWHGARFVRLDWEAGVMAFNGVPTWLCEAIIPLGFGLMAARFAAAALTRASRP